MTALVSVSASCGSARPVSARRQPAAEGQPGSVQVAVPAGTASPGSASPQPASAASGRKIRTTGARLA